MSAVLFYGIKLGRVDFYKIASQLFPDVFNDSCRHPFIEKGKFDLSGLGALFEQKFEIDGSDICRHTSKGVEYLGFTKSNIFGSYNHPISSDTIETKLHQVGSKRYFKSALEITDFLCEKLGKVEGSFEVGWWLI